MTRGTAITLTFGVTPAAIAVILVIRESPAFGLALLAALPIYLCAHALRLVRLAILLGDTAPSLRQLTAAQLGTVAAGAVLPFKIGEVGRWLAISEVAGGPMAGLRALWVERAFDAALLAAAAGAAAILVPDARSAVAPVGAVALAVLALTGAALVVLPENVSMAKSFLIRRYTTAWSLRLLSILTAIGTEVRAAGHLVRGKLATLGLLTIGIWSAEAGALAVLIPRTEAYGRAVLAGSLWILSAVVLPGVDLVGDALNAHHLVVLTAAIGLSCAAAASLALKTARTAT